MLASSTRLRATATLALLTFACASFGPATAANPRPKVAPLAAHMVAPGFARNPYAIQGLHTVTTIGSTMDATLGDGNPYGLIQYPTASGKIAANNFLVCNFNDGFNLQSFGTTLETIAAAPGSKASRVVSDPRFTGCGALALGVSSTTNPIIWTTSYSANELVAMDSSGNVLGTVADGSLAGPWGLASMYPTKNTLYVSNAYTGNIVRVDFTSAGPTFTTIVTGIQPNHGVPGTILAPSGLIYFRNPISSRSSTAPETGSLRSPWSAVCLITPST